MIDLLVRYAHFISIIVLASALVAQHLFYSPAINAMQCKKLRTLNIIYGAGAIVAFITGMLLWLAVGKPKEFYSQGGLIHMKMTLFIIMGLLSVVPTIFYKKASKLLAQNEAPITPPKYVIGVIRAELVILLLLPLIAVFMAAGKV